MGGDGTVQVSVSLGISWQADSNKTSSWRRLGMKGYFVEDGYNSDDCSSVWVDLRMGVCHALLLLYQILNCVCVCVCIDMPCRIQIR